MKYYNMKQMKPFEARAKLKSIKYWQSVVKGELPAKRPIAYYQNKLLFYSTDRIKKIEELSQTYILQPKSCK